MGRFAQARKTTTTNSTTKTDTVTLSDALGREDILPAISRALGGVATPADVEDLGRMALLDVRTRLAEVGKAATALAKSLSADDVRISTKDGSKTYAYAVLKVESGAVSVGTTISDAVGETLAPFAARKG